MTEYDADMYAVYGHYEPGADLPFYIGEGKVQSSGHCKRSRQYFNRNDDWREVFNSFEGPPDIIIYSVHADKRDAYSEEKRRIGDMRKVPGHRLTNWTGGGGGCWNLTEESRERFREASRRQWAERTEEERTAIGVKANAALTAEEHSEKGRRAAARQTPEQRSEAKRKANARLTPEQRSERQKKGWETRRRNKAEREAK